MGQEEGKKRADAFYRANLPFGMARYIGCGWRSFANAQAEFCFERVHKGKPEYSSIVLYEKQLTGSEEDLVRVLRETQAPSFHNYEPCEHNYMMTARGHGGPERRRWQRN